MSVYKIRNFIIHALILIFAFVLQSSVFSRIPLFGSAPNIVLVLTFIHGYSNSKIAGMMTGLFGGLMIDVFFCDVIGYHALVLLIIGFFSGVWDSLFYSDDLYVPLILLTLSDLVYCILYFLVWYVLRARFDISFYLFQVLLPEFLLTLISGVILYKPVSALINRLKMVPEQ